MSDKKFEYGKRSHREAGARTRAEEMGHAPTQSEREEMVSGPVQGALFSLASAAMVNGENITFSSQEGPFRTTNEIVEALHAAGVIKQKRQADDDGVVVEVPLTKFEAACTHNKLHCAVNGEGEVTLRSHNAVVTDEHHTLVDTPAVVPHSPKNLLE